MKIYTLFAMLIMLTTGSAMANSSAIPPGTSVKGDNIKSVGYRGLISGISRVEKSSTAVLTAAECLGTLIVNQGATGSVSLTPYALSQSSTVTIMLEEVQNIKLIPPTGEAFDLDGTLLDANDHVDSDSVEGSAIVLIRCKDHTGAWIWRLYSSRGTWSDVGGS
jgi:hypothetical protein